MLLKEKATRDVLRKAYRNLDNDFKSLPYCNLIDIIKEYENDKQISLLRLVHTFIKHSK